MLSICRLSSSIPISRFSLFSNQAQSVLTLSLVIRPRFSTLRRFAAVSSVVATDSSVVKNGGDTFLAEESISWSSLGVSDDLTRALSRIGLHRPSLVQAACIPRLFSGADTVIAAETGSGKTHGYLVPVMDRLLKTNVESGEALPSQALHKNREISLVLCPNVMLCEQVVHMANSLCEENGRPLLSAVAICGRQGWPTLEPKLIVSTPMAFLNYLYAIHPEKDRRDDFIRGVKYLVFDEADMLLCGSFQNQVMRLINMFRFDEKQISCLKDPNLHSELDSGQQGLESEIDSIDAIASNLDSEMDNSRGINRDLQAVTNSCNNESLQSIDLENEARIDKRKDWRRVRKSYERSKQYIFVAATLPVNGKQTAGGVLKRLFPDVCWVNGNFVHCHNPRLEQKWIEVTVDTQVDALISAINISLDKVVDPSSEIKRTMVFANTVEAVEAISKVLAGAGIDCFSYHSDRPLEERTESLSIFRLEGGVFVCTDSAARGLDVPDVHHVIQAEFASSAVDFLHRVGRTARAGQAGIVTSLYKHSNRDLVAAIREAEKLGQQQQRLYLSLQNFHNGNTKAVFPVPTGPLIPMMKALLVKSLLMSGGDRRVYWFVKMVHLPIWAYPRICLRVPYALSPW